MYIYFIASKWIHKIVDQTERILSWLSGCMTRLGVHGRDLPIFLWGPESLLFWTDALSVNLREREDQLNNQRWVTVSGWGSDTRRSMSCVKQPSREKMRSINMVRRTPEWTWLEAVLGELLKTVLNTEKMIGDTDKSECPWELLEVSGLSVEFLCKNVFISGEFEFETNGL